MSARPRLSSEQRRQIATEFAGGESAHKLAKKFSVSWSTVYYIGREYSGSRIARNRPPELPQERTRYASPSSFAPAIRSQAPLVGPGFVQPSLNDLIILDARDGLSLDEICALRRCERSRVEDVLRRAYKFEFITPAVAQRLNIARAG